MIRVVIADDHHLVRQGIRALLEKAEDVEVIGEGADGQEAIDLVRRLVPDVLIVDVAMPGLNGLEALRRVRSRGGNTRVLVLSMYADENLVRQALRDGATGYLLKRAIADELRLAVRAVHRGETYLSPQVAGPLLATIPELHADSDATTPLERLTPREREVLQLIAEGHTNGAIASRLQLSEKTIEKHRGNVMAKLHVHDVTGLVRFAIKHRVIDLEN